MSCRNGAHERARSKWSEVGAAFRKHASIQGTNMSFIACFTDEPVDLFWEWHPRKPLNNPEDSEAPKTRQPLKFLLQHMQLPTKSWSQEAYDKRRSYQT